ncbi:MAG: glycerol-3-phosphate acyltransferase [Chloroflexi bacterium]|nr:glycerol-3-phosphate acyltransferase [Chloroflexota bacterium]
MTGMVLLQAMGFALLGYLSGSLAFSIWITRLVKGVDVREGGSGHATATNTIRQAGWLPGASVLFLDLAKGFLPTFMALYYSGEAWIAALTGAMAVVGHCWPVFAGFRGGMGLAAAGGAILAASPLGFVICLGVLILMVLALRHSARGSVAAGLLMPLALWFLGQRGAELWIAAAVGVVIALRFTIDWNRQYRELWLDRQTLGN